MFICKNETMYENIKEYMPELYINIEKIYDSVDTDNFQNVVKQEFEKMEAVSIDYGVMEKTKKIYVIPGNFGWDDVGGWLSVERINPEDENNNVIKGNVVYRDSNNNIILNNTNNLIATLGLENMVIVNTSDVTLIMSKEKTNNIKELIKKIEIDENNKRFL